MSINTILSISFLASLLLFGNAMAEGGGQDGSGTTESPIKEIVYEKLLEDSNWALIWAISEGHIDVLTWLIQQKVSLDVSIEEGKTLLHYAADRGSREIVKILLEHGLSVHAWDEQGWQSMHYAAANNDLEMLEFLHSNGAELNAGTNIPYPDNAVWRPIHLAAANGHRQAVEWFILKGVSSDMPQASKEDGIDNWSKFGTPAAIAGEHGHWELVKWLYEQGTDIRECWTDNPPDYLLNKAIYQEDKDAVMWLLDKRVDANRPGLVSYSPIKQIILFGGKNRTLLLKLLINAGGDVDCQTALRDLYWLDGFDIKDLYWISGIDIDEQSDGRAETRAILEEYCSQEKFGKNAEMEADSGKGVANKDEL